MNTTHNTKTKRLVTAVGVAAAAAVAPALLFTGAGTAQAAPNPFCAAVITVVAAACSVPHEGELTHWDPPTIFDPNKRKEEANGDLVIGGYEPLA